MRGGSRVGPSHSSRPPLSNSHRRQPRTCKPTVERTAESDERRGAGRTQCVDADVLGAGVVHDRDRVWPCSTAALVRKKNVLGVMMQCVFLMGMMTVIWALWGYSFAFGGKGAWFGNFDYLFMNGVARSWDAVSR